jgi:hypothetical protein
MDAGLNGLLNLLFMGCCSAGNRRECIETLKNSIKICIEANNVERLSGYITLIENIESYKGTELNVLEVAKVQSASFNCLGFALWLGHLKVFKFLYERKELSVVLMENAFREESTTGIEIICKNQFVDFLNYYLPIYISSYSQFLIIGTLPNTIFNLIRAGNITFLANIHRITQEFQDLPEELDIHKVDRETGNNSFLVACQCCNLACLKFLVQKCQVDYNCKNNDGKGAAQLAIGG